MNNHSHAPINPLAIQLYCQSVWQRPVDIKASNYFINLLIRRVQGFSSYLPTSPTNRPVTRNDIYRAASIYFD
mgnify:CR=1 FL=1